MEPPKMRLSGKVCIGEMGQRFAPLEEISDGDWRAAQQDEIDLVLYLTRAAWPHLKARGGAVVNMASLNGQ